MYNVAVALQLLHDEARPVVFAAIEIRLSVTRHFEHLKKFHSGLDTVLNNTMMAVILMDDLQEVRVYEPGSRKAHGIHS